jgi:hypothetical protein
VSAAELPAARLLQGAPSPIQFLIVLEEAATLGWVERPSGESGVLTWQQDRGWRITEAGRAALEQATKDLAPYRACPVCGEQHPWGKCA